MFTGAPMKLCCYDFDHTLVETASSIRLASTGERISQERYEEIKAASLDDRGLFDFSEYDKIIDPEINELVYESLKKDMDAGNDVYILTARRNPTPVIGFIDDLFGTGTLPVVSVNVEGFEFELEGDHKRKAAWIEHMLHSQSYDGLIFFEDSEKNLSEVLKLKETHEKMGDNFELELYLVEDGRPMPIY